MRWHLNILIFAIFAFMYLVPAGVFANEHDSSAIGRGLKEVVDESSKQRFFYSLNKWRDDLAAGAPSTTNKLPAYIGVGILTVLIVVLPWIIVHRRHPFRNDKRKIILRWFFVQSAYLILALMSVVILHLMGYAPNLLDALAVSFIAVFIAAAINISYFLVNPEIG